MRSLTNAPGAIFLKDMSDKTITRDNPSVNADSGNEQTSRILFDDTQSGVTKGRFEVKKKENASACDANPAEGTVPTLTFGQKTNGCDFRGMQDIPKGTGHLDFPDIYKQMAGSTVRFDANMSYKKPDGKTHTRNGPMGSGVMIGKDSEAGECLIATNNHVVQGDSKVKMTDQRAVTADGKVYPSEIRFQDPKRDTAVVAIKTGADTDKVCRPAKVAEDLSIEAKKGTGAVSFGFPQGSAAMYASPGLSGGIKRADSYMHPRELKQLDLDPKANHLLLRNHVKGGQSGGPVVNEKGVVIGINQSGPETMRDTTAMPLDTKRVRQLLDASRR